MTSEYNSALSKENAPAGPRCPNCRLAVPAPWVSSTPGADFAYCTAKPLIPAFGGAYLAGCMENRVGMAINLALFDPASTYAEFLNGKDCPLFEHRAQAEGEGAK